MGLFKHHSQLILFISLLFYGCSSPQHVNDLTLKDSFESTRREYEIEQEEHLKDDSRPIQSLDGTVVKIIDGNSFWLKTDKGKRHNIILEGTTLAGLSAAKKKKAKDALTSSIHQRPVVIYFRNQAKDEVITGQVVYYKQVEDPSQFGPMNMTVVINHGMIRSGLLNRDDNQAPIDPPNTPR